MSFLVYLSRIFFVSVRVYTIKAPSYNVRNARQSFRYSDTLRVYSSSVQNLLNVYALVSEISCVVD